MPPDPLRHKAPAVERVNGATCTINRAAALKPSTLGHAHEPGQQPDVATQGAQKKWRQSSSQPGKALASIGLAMW